jgi:N-succinyldiaminopimelate aminotransferase
MSKSMFRQVPKTGVIFTTASAMKLGFYRGHPDWCNFGQGQPETGFLDGGLERISHIHIDEGDHEYAPVGGLLELREAIANMYNTLYRKNKKSKYTAENVSIAGGGRTILTRLVAAIDTINLGHFLPDYTAYEELLSTFQGFNTIPIMLDPDNGYTFSHQDLRKEIQGKGLGAVLASNPCNPTGKTISGRHLREWIKVSRDTGCSLIMDEFYSSYVWEGVPSGDTLSCCGYINDVNKENILIVNGLGKNQRYPGWRIGWVVGPKEVIKSINSAGSFLDGGAPRPIQRAAIPLLSPEAVTQETKSIHKEFSQKRQVMMDGLRKIGVTFDCEPGGSFYLWGNVSALPEGLNTGMDFFHACLEKKVIAVPGEFFDVNPGKRMKNAGSRFKNYLRFSYGPDINTINKGLARLEEMVRERS